MSIGPANCSISIVRPSQRRSAVAADALFAFMAAKAPMDFCAAAMPASQRALTASALVNTGSTGRSAASTDPARALAKAKASGNMAFFMSFLLDAVVDVDVQPIGKQDGMLLEADDA